MNKLFLIILLICFCSALYAQKTVYKTGKLIDSRDSEIYSTVKIGKQIWMAENLRYQVEGSYLNPKNPDKNYGRLYNWSQVMGIDSMYNTKEFNADKKQEGICPKGWHIPTYDEWTELIIKLGKGSENYNEMKGKAGHKMKSSTIFQAVPAGKFDAGINSFYFFGTSSEFWTATEVIDNASWYICLLWPNSSAERHRSEKEDGLSCRCVKN